MTTGATIKPVASVERCHQSDVGARVSSAQATLARVCLSSATSSPWKCRQSSQNSRRSWLTRPGLMPNFRDKFHVARTEPLFRRCAGFGHLAGSANPQNRCEKQPLDRPPFSCCRSVLLAKWDRHRNRVLRVATPGSRVAGGRLATECPGCFLDRSGAGQPSRVARPGCPDFTCRAARLPRTEGNLEASLFLAAKS